LFDNVNINIINMTGARRFAQALTNDLCCQNVKIKIKVKVKNMRVSSL